MTHFAPRSARRLACAAALCAAACQSPPVIAPDGQERVGDALRGVRTRGDISSFVGAAPRSCLPISPAAELCEWRISNRERGFGRIAGALETGDRVTLLCELPTDGSTRGAGSCTAYPRRSDRLLWQKGTPPRRAVATRHAPRAPAGGPDLRAVAAARIEAARTLVELSRLLGAAPDECFPRADGAQWCIWRTSSATYGHGTLATWIGAPYGKRVRLSCLLPADGSPREPESCLAEIGS